jgi:hypothetical protein
MTTPAALDRFDLAILDILQADNTTPQRAIAQAVNLSAPAVQRRIQRLKDSGVIRANVAVLDPVKVGKPLTIVLEVHLGNLFKVFSGIALECNRDEWMLRMRRMGSCPCKQPGRQSSEFIGPISLQPFGQVPCRAVCGVAALANSTGYWLRPAPCTPSRQGTCATPKRP